MPKITNYHERPICINHGCITPCTYSFIRKDGAARWSVYCGNCARAETGARKHKRGVTPFRNGTCSNAGGRLGFKCPTDHSLVPKDINLTELDHIDGNPYNNVHSNIQELCVCCHKIKTVRNGDIDGHKRRR